MVPQVDLQLLMTHPADLSRFPQRSYCLLVQLQGPGMCKITGFVDSGCVCVCVHVLSPDTVALSKQDTHCFPLIIQEPAAPRC